MNNKNDKNNEKEKNEKDSLLKTLKMIGIGIAGTMMFGCAGTIICAANTPAQTNTPTETSNIIKKPHLRAGNHNVILTQSFYDALDKDNQFRCDLVMKGLKECYDTLNEYNRGLHFNLCTQVPELANDYYIPLVNETAKDDIFIHGTNDNSLGGKAIGLAETRYDLRSYELYNLKITFKLKELYYVWNNYLYSAEKTLNTPHNAAIYSCAVHETMHTMGIPHITDRNSIMNTVLKGSSKELTEEDIKLLDEYNMNFYGTKSIFEEETENAEYNDYTTDMSM